MSTLLAQLNEVRLTALKEISGLVTLLGEDIDNESKQQTDPLYVHYGLGKEGVFVLKHVNVEDLVDNLSTPQLKRIAVWNGEPERPMGASHTWSSIDPSAIHTDDLIKIHAALEEKLNVMLHRA